MSFTRDKEKLNMNNTLDFETAITLLETIRFGNIARFEGALMFVSEAFDVSMDKLLDILDERG